MSRLEESNTSEDLPQACIDREIVLGLAQPLTSLPIYEIEPSIYGFSLGAYRRNAYISLFNKSGFGELVGSFKVLRQLTGEAQFQGLEPIYIDSSESTPVPEYLRILSERGLPISNLLFYGRNHDLYSHILGGLLMSEELASIVQAKALVASQEPQRTQEIVASHLDTISFNVHSMWIEPEDNSGYRPEAIANALILIDHFLEQDKLGLIDPMDVSHRQRDAIELLGTVA